MWRGASTLPDNSYRHFCADLLLPIKLLILLLLIALKKMLIAEIMKPRINY